MKKKVIAALVACSIVGVVMLSGIGNIGEPELALNENPSVVELA